MQNGSCWNYWLCILRVMIDNVPVKMIAIYAAGNLFSRSSPTGVRGINNLHALSLSAIVHVRLEGRNSSRLEQHGIAIRPHVFGVGWDFKILIIAGVR